jgi:hypothetical protein
MVKSSARRLPVDESEDGARLGLGEAEAVDGLREEERSREE